ncbi:flavoprotein, partial [Anoxybacillus kestanbolensis]|uniref:flavoprotein n=1 Tax=Anoxybacillus kestanbolensis TaxID=227476 RepID=UPI003D1D7FB2
RSPIFSLYLFAVEREKTFISIYIVCTSNVQKFIDVNFLAAHADAPAYQDMYDFPKEYTRNRVPHSFNTLAKCANGIADNLLTMLVLCSPRPVVFFPNMEPNMWDAKYS